MGCPGGRAGAAVQWLTANGVDWELLDRRGRLVGWVYAGPGYPGGPVWGVCYGGLQGYGGRAATTDAAMAAVEAALWARAAEGLGG